MQQATTFKIIKVNGNKARSAADTITTEEPLEIRLQYTTRKGLQRKSISVTMRTPGNDAELATGFLYTENIISGISDIKHVAYTDLKNNNVVLVTLTDNVQPDLGRLERNFYTSSSCGVCGKSSIESVRVSCPIVDTKNNIVVSLETLYSLPDKLRNNQEVFSLTGGLHGCAIFDLSGNIIVAREDAGRHNALDKLIGAAINMNILPLNKHILMLSGRISFELVQKAAMAGIKIIAAVGAPSSLAIEMANEWGMTMIGFLRHEKFNVYAGAERIDIEAKEQ
jgi:FdhD protein